MTNIDDLVSAILKRKNVNYDLLEESREVDGFADLNLIITLLIEDKGFDLLINPSKLEDISEGKNKLIENVILKYSEEQDYLKISSYDFLDILEDASEERFNTQNKTTKSQLKNSTVIGIDLGTTFSVAAFFEKGNDSTIKGKGVTIPTPEGSRLFPSIVLIGLFVTGSITSSEALRFLISRLSIFLFSSAAVLLVKSILWMVCFGASDVAGADFPDFV